MSDTIHLVSVSGGKDSTATCLHLTELGIPHRRVFADTGWELPETYAYLDYLRERLGPIDVVRGPRQMEELILNKQMFPSRTIRYCTTFLKFMPIKEYIEGLQDEGYEVVNAIGIRAEESRERRDLPEREHDDGMGCDVWRPLIAWTLEDVIAIHKRHSLTPNPLYLQGYTRVGCAPCIMARKAEVKLTATRYPGQIDRIRRLEAAMSGHVGLAGRAPAFFQASIPVKQRMQCSCVDDGLDSATCGECGGAGIVMKNIYPGIPIDEVVEWSRTDRGGRQFPLFEADHSRDGCMRWGLCDTQGEK